MYQSLLLVWLLGLFGGQAAVSDSTKYDCLPADVKADEVVSYGRKPADNVTVGKKLIEMKARCRQKSLVDANQKEIRFFRVSCWGNPPPDYLEKKQKEREQLDKLKKDY